MKVRALPIAELRVIEPSVHGDARGYFYESWNRARYAEHGVPFEVVQANVSRSAEGVLRGLHYQWPKPQGKLVSVLEGEVYDVAVDIRRGSPTFGQWEAFELNDENLHIAYCPIGFAHGFATLSDVADVMYKQTGYYADETERGISYQDPDVGIKWPDMELIPSERDTNAPLLRDVADELPFAYEG